MYSKVKKNLAKVIVQLTLFNTIQVGQTNYKNTGDLKIKKSKNSKFRLKPLKIPKLIKIILQLMIILQDNL